MRGSILGVIKKDEKLGPLVNGNPHVGARMDLAMKGPAKRQSDFNKHQECLKTRAP